MKNIQNLLKEVKGEKAHKQAVAMGLKYKGFGYWVDPATGEVAYKTENDTLVPVEPEVESEKAGAGPADAAGGAPSGGMGNPEGVGGSFGTFMNKQLPLGTGTNVQGIADNGMAQSPNDDNGRWEPGPDGDNFINDQQKGAGMDIKKDAFVSGPNHYGWTAGPDGDNFTTMTIDQIMKKAFSVNQGDYESEVALGEQIWDYLMEGASDPSFGFSFDGRDTLINKLRQSQVSPKPPEQQQGTAAARSALGKLTTGARGKALESLGKTPYIHAPAYDGEYEPGEYTKALKAQQKIWRLPAKVQDTQLLGRMNNNIQGLISNPDFDMSLKGEELGEGAFGQVYDSADGSAVIKEGEIGPHELAALFAMRDNPAFPTLLNAKFDTPFLNQNAMERDQPLIGRDTQFNPDDYSEWEKRFPTARGTYAMSKMKGQPLADAVYSMTEEQQENALNEIWRARAALHAAGFSHNDMHGNNIFVDDEGHASIMDLGLANDDPLSALLEALGGLNDGEEFGAPGDYQLSKHARLKNLPDDVQADLLNRRENIREMIMDNVPDTWDADVDEAPFNMVEELLNGEIRGKTRDLDGIREMIPYLADKGNVKKLIKELYGKFLMSDQEGRMSDAFDKLQADSRKVRLANLLRKQRGEKEIEVKNKAVVPPKNLIFDEDD